VILAAPRYIEGQRLGDIDWHVDVIAITAGPGPLVVKLEHICDAVEGRIP
jgi:hypothetical protein